MYLIPVGDLIQEIKRTVHSVYYTLPKLCGRLNKPMQQGRKAPGKMDWAPLGRYPGTANPAGQMGSQWALQDSTEDTAGGRNLQACTEASLQDSAVSTPRVMDSVQQTKPVKN